MMKRLFVIGRVLCVLAGPTVPAMSADLFKVNVQNYYKKRTDGTVGRLLTLHYRGETTLNDAKVQVSWNQGQETYSLSGMKADSAQILLAPNIGVKQNDTVIVSLIFSDKKITEEVIVPAMRYWTVYIYPHSHVDVGYTNTQENIEFIHKRNLDVAMDLAEKTKNYPADAKFRWNPEVVWPVERYLKSESKEKCKRLLEAIKRGDIAVDAGYVSTNTSASSDEELLQLFSFAKKIEKETGVPIETMVQTDIPGMTWGIVSAANQMGVKYILSLFNGFDRIGWSKDLSFRPFWWVAPDGKSKVLFLQPGAYTPGALAKGKYFWPKLAGQTDRSKLIPVVETDNPRANFIDSYLEEMLPKLENDKDYPYDIFPMTWCMADNTPVDIDLPEAVKSWNEEYVYPHIKICTATDIMKAFDERWGEQLPELKGDFTEYWTDGLGSSAEKTGKSREVKERLVQAEILWSLLSGDKGEPQDMVDEAWRNMILSTEHTWAFMDPNKQPIQNNILNTKYGYFDKAESITNDLLSMSYSKIEDKNSNQITVFNTESWNRTDLVVLSKELALKGDIVMDSDGNEVLSQVLSSGELVFMAENIPALGFRSYRICEGNRTKTSSSQQSVCNVLDNGLVQVKIDPSTGDVSSVRFGNEEFVDAEALVALNSYRYLKGGESSGRAYKPTNIRIRQGESGPLVSSLIVESDARGCNSLVREVKLVKGSAAVYFNNTVDKQNILEKEGIHFGFAFDIPQSKTHVNIPWGEFELEKEQLKAANRNWIAMQRWLNISNADKNVTWCSINSCMFESGDMTANIIGSAFESPKWIRSLEPSSTIYSWALNNHWHTNFRLSQEGEINLKYSILLSLGSYDIVKSHHFALAQVRPLIAVQTKNNFKLSNSLKLGNNDRIVLSNYQTIDKGNTSIIRLLSLSENEEMTSLSWEKKLPKSVTCINTGERLPILNGEVKVANIPAKGIVTLQVKW